MQCGPCPPPGDLFLCYWSLYFRDRSYDWSYSDVVVGGTYSCGGGVIVTGDGREMYYDYSRDGITWEGVFYEACDGPSCDRSETTCPAAP